MSISPDLMYALLSMDAYNQGYAPGIAGVGTTIGTATVTHLEAFGIDQTKLDEWQAAGFSAVAYEWNGETIISYRGTDFQPAGDLADDVIEGWAIGGGDYMAAQAELAVEFLDAVQPDGEQGSVVLTGHSLGGGLAGAIAA